MKPSSVRFLLRLAIAPLLVAAMSAQIRVDPYATRHFPVGLWPIESNDFAAGDVDADGDLDLVVAENRGAPLLFRNQGDGVFAPAVQLPVAHGRTSLVAMVDCDGDGDLDLFFCGGGTAYGSGQPCILLRNDGAGTFAPYGSMPATQPFASRLDTGDLDGDGDIDFLIGGSPPLYLRNDGGGVYSDQTAAIPGFGFLCDLDGDGVLDIVDGTNFHRGLGNGSFTSSTLPFGVSFAGDLDGDGDVDLIGYDGAQRTRRNDGSGNFTAVGSVPLLTQQPWRTPLHAIDLDGDGYRELLSLDTHCRPVVLHHSGNFVFTDVTAAWIEPQIPTAIDYVWAAAAWFDVDGDGDIDCITGGAEGRGTSSTTVGIPPRLYLNAGTVPGPRFVEATKTPFPRLQHDGNPAAAGDVDGDGDADLVFGDVWLQGRDGRYTRGPALPPANGFSFFPINGPGLLRDFDGDGDLDLFLTDGPGRGLPAPGLVPRLCRNDGHGNFTGVALPASTFTVGTACAAGDVDGDGDIDIVLGGRSPDFSNTGARLMLLRNDGNMVFADAAPQMPTLLHQCGVLVLRDLDGDGDLDVLSGTEDGYHSTPSAVLFVNDGTGHFTDATGPRIPADPNAYGLAVADFDGDGDLDFAQQRPSFLGTAARIYINDGSGTFTAQLGPRGTHVVDWTGDDTLVDLWDNQGSTLTIGDQQIPWTAGFGGTTGPITLLPFDHDGDGDLDLAVGGLPTFGGGQFSVFHQGLVVNLHRDLRLASQPRLGQPFRAQVRAVNGTAATAAWIGVSAALLPQRVPVPALGRGLLAIDPTQLLALDFALVPDADTAVEVVHPMPALPAILGLEVAAQALFVPLGHERDAQFSNVVVERIAR